MNDKNDRDQRRQRTPAAEAAIRAAHDRVYELADDPTACMEEFAPLFLAAVAPERRADALRALRTLLHDPQGRLEFVLMAYQSALRLYEAGAFDNEAAA
jgi:hypothetical protein